jgi:hypothetical protein
LRGADRAHTVATVGGADPRTVEVAKVGAAPGFKVAST